MAEIGPPGGLSVAPTTELHLYITTEEAWVKGEGARNGRVVEKCIFLLEGRKSWDNLGVEP
jgi:hypothetical protein